MKKMNRKKDILQTLNIGVVVLLFVSTFFVRCASIMVPDGGPYDTIPPVIVAMTPENFTTNFEGKKIYIEFDEFVKLTDQSKEFFTSPQMKVKPKLSTRGRGVVVTLGDSLAPNTTYALNFGTTIRDNNEGNPLYSMRYVFSTGDEIDSMIMSGYAEDSYKSDSVSGALIYFFIADSVERVAEYDSVMFNYTPAVIARSEANGIFLAQNLKPIDYRVYAFEDRNSNFIYEPETDQVGFIDSIFNPANLPDFSLWFDSVRGYAVADPQLHFKLFEDKAYKRQNLQESERPLQHKAVLYFATTYPQIESILFDSIPEEDFIVEPLSAGRDTLAIWFNLDSHMIPDTIRGSVTYFKHDSVRNLVETTDPLRLTWRFFETKEAQKERERLERERLKAEEAGEEWVAPKVQNPFRVTLTSGGGINPDDPLTMSFEYPLIDMDTTAITLAYISTDSVRTQQPIVVERDTANLRLWYIRSRFEHIEGKYELIIADSAFTNIAREVNDSIGVNYTLHDPEQFASINVNFTKSQGDEAEYIIELIDGNKRRLNTATVSKSETVTFKYVPATDISLRVIQDTNGDGERSSGNLVERLQPERVAYYQKDGETTFTMKVNWEFDFDLKAEELFVPESMQSLIERLDKEEMQRLEKAAAAKTGTSGDSRSNSSRNR